MEIEVSKDVTLDLTVKGDVERLENGYTINDFKVFMEGLDITDHIRDWLKADLEDELIQAVSDLPEYMDRRVL